MAQNIKFFFYFDLKAEKRKKKKKKEKKKGKERKEGKRERKKEKKRKKEERESEYLYERKGPDSAYNFVLFYTFDKRYGSYENSNILLKKPKFSLNHDRKMIIFQKNCSLRSQNHKDRTSLCAKLHIFSFDVKFCKTTQEVFKDRASMIQKIQSKNPKNPSNPKNP